MNIPVMQRNIMTSRSLEGKVSLVTGSTSGIGLGIACALAAAGSSIVLNGFGNPQEIAATRSRLGSEFKVGVDYSPADMSKPEAIRDMVDGILKSSGRLDVVVNNAGIQHVAPIQEFPVEKWQLILAINLSSAFHTTRCALPSMREHGWGRIINIASAHGLVASPFKSAYVAAKHGLIGLTKVTALETAEDGITCNAICPRRRPRPTTSRGSRWCATCSWRSSRTRSSRRSKRLARSPCSWRATPRPRSPGSHCPSTEAGRRTEVSVVISARVALRCPALDRVPRQRKSIPVPFVESSNKRGGRTGRPPRMFNSHAALGGQVHREPCASPMIGGAWFVR